MSAFIGGETSKMNTKKVTKAIIPAAGLGTRMLPISRAVPKEMLPIVDYPAIYHLVKEAADSGIKEVLIITGRDKDSIEDFFDYSPEYDKKLSAGGKLDQIKELHDICDMANVYFVRQKDAKGLGHAVGCARAFVGNDPFLVMYGDDIIFSKTPVCQQLMDTYEKYGRPVVGVKPVPMELISRYCSLKAEPIQGGNNEYFVDDMIEKPKPEQVFTNLSILGRVLLEPNIFDILETLPAGAGGEIQLTDAMRIVARDSGVTALEFEGERFDLGSKLGFLMANVTRGIEHAEVGADFRAFLKDFVSKL